METLPDELITEILVRLPPRHIFTVVSRTSRRFLRLSRTLTGEQGRPWFLADITVVPSGGPDILEVERNRKIWLDRFESVRGLPNASAESNLDGGGVRHIAVVLPFVVTERHLASLNAGFLTSLVAPARLAPAGFRTLRTKWIATTPGAAAQLAVAAFFMRKTSGLVGPFKWATTFSFLFPVLLAPAPEVHGWPSTRAGGVASITVDQLSSLELLFTSKSDSAQLGAALKMVSSGRPFLSVRTLVLQTNDRLLINEQWVRDVSKIDLLFAPGRVEANKIFMDVGELHSQRVPRRVVQALINNSTRVTWAQLDAKMFLGKLDAECVHHGMKTLTLSFTPPGWGSKPDTLQFLHEVGENIASVFPNLEDLELVGLFPNSMEIWRWSNLVFNCVSLITSSGAKRAFVRTHSMDYLAANGMDYYFRAFLVDLKKHCGPRGVAIRLATDDMY